MSMAWLAAIMLAEKPFVVSRSSAEGAHARCRTYESASPIAPLKVRVGVNDAALCVDVHSSSSPDKYHAEAWLILAIDKSLDKDRDLFLDIRVDLTR